MENPICDSHPISSAQSCPRAAWPEIPAPCVTLANPSLSRACVLSPVHGCRSGKWRTVGPVVGAGTVAACCLCSGPSQATLPALSPLYPSGLEHPPLLLGQLPLGPPGSSPRIGPPTHTHALWPSFIPRTEELRGASPALETGNQAPG